MKARSGIIMAATAATISTIFCFAFVSSNSKAYFHLNFNTGILPTLELGNITLKNEENQISLNTGKESIYFVGDIMLGRDVEKYILNKGFDYPYRKFSFNSKRSFVVGNFEASIPAIHVSTPANTFKFSVKEDFLPALYKAGFTHLSLANNHSFDFGLAGYNNTVTKLWDNNLTPFGHPSILATSSVTFLDLDNEITAAIIAIHTLYGDPSAAKINEVINYASANSDIQIVYIHWGDEYTEKQSKSQRKLAAVIAEAGADVIIGHHPHVTQGIEMLGNTLVFYSLGNYIFDQYFSDSVQSGLVLQLSLNSKLNVVLYPITSLENNAQPELMTNENRTIFLNNLAEKSSENLREEIKSGNIIMDFTIASSSEVVIMTE